MNVVRNMLPKNLPGPTSAPPSQSPAGSEWVLVPKTKTNLPTQTPPVSSINSSTGSATGDNGSAKRDSSSTALTTDCKTNDGKSVNGTSDSIPITKIQQSAVDSELTPEQRLLRDQLLSIMEPRINRPPSMRFKQIYFTIGPTQIGLGSTTEAAAILNTITLGSGLSDRLGLSVRCHYLRIRGTIQFYQVTTPAQAISTMAPFVRHWIVRDKIPTTPGAVPSMVIAGANPPQASDFPFSNLGNPLSTRGTVIMCIPSPTGAPLIHIYKDEIFPKTNKEGLWSMNTVYTGGSIAQLQPVVIHFQHDVDLGGCKTDFILGSSNPISNGINFNWRGDSELLYHGILYQYTSELVFEDMTTE